MAAEILLKNARLIDGLRGEPVENASILIKGDRIAAMQAGAKTQYEVCFLGGNVGRAVHQAERLYKTADAIQAPEVVAEGREHR